MKIYIVDDDPVVVQVLKGIVAKYNLGSVVGYSSDSLIALEDIIFYTPDIVLLDYLMPNLDGCSLIKKIREIDENIYFVMVSQVENTKMVEETYIAGVEFFIHKPINIIEVKRVIESVIEKVDMKKQLSLIKGILGEGDIVKNPIHVDRLEEISFILSDIGILGEKGSADIIKICRECLGRSKVSPWSILPEVLRSRDKVVKQRIRRALSVGFKNIVHSGLEDNLSETFVKYSNTLFDFQEVYLEMEHIRRGSIQKGRINTLKFIENLMVQATKS